MKLLIKRCARGHCTALAFGPRAAKLYPLGGRLWCRAHWREQLEWEAEDRETVLAGFGHLAKIWKVYPEFRVPKPAQPKSWRGLLEELSGLAGIALEHGDKKSFTHYASRALWAWELSGMEKT